MRQNIGQSSKKVVLISVGIVMLALFVRLWYLYESSANPSFTTPIVDSGTYDDLARSVVAGGGMDSGFFWQPFFYPVFLSIVYLVGNSSIIFAKAVQLFLGCVTCLLTYRLGERTFNRPAGVIAGVMTALYGPLVFFEAELLATGWAAFWSVVLILLFIRSSSKKNVWCCVVLGMCGALSIMTRPTFIPFLIAGAVWLAIVFLRSGEEWTGVSRRLGATLGGFLFIAIPVAAQNLRIAGHFGFLPASGTLNMYIGNNENYTETILARPGYGWKEITLLPKQNGFFGGLWEQQEFYKQEVAKYVFTEPLGFVKGLAYKTIQFLNSREIPRNLDVYLFGKWSRLLGLLTWKVREFGFPFGVLLPLALLGAVGCWRRIPMPLLLFIILYPLSIILVFVAARYRVAVIPVMSVIAAGGLVNLIETVRGFHWCRIVTISVFGLAIVLLSSLPGPFPEEKCNFEAELYYDVAFAESSQGKTQEAVKHFLQAAALLTKAVQVQPNSAPAHFLLAQASAKAGMTHKAITHFKETMRLKPHWVCPMNSLAWILATHSQVKFRNPEEAVRLARRACEVTNYQDAGFLDTLAAAYAAAGKFSDAVTAGRKAVKLISSTRDKERAEKFQNRVELYRQKKHYRQPSPKCPYQPLRNITIRAE